MSVKSVHLTLDVPSPQGTQYAFLHPFLGLRGLPEQGDIPEALPQDVLSRVSQTLKAGLPQELGSALPVKKAHEAAHSAIFPLLSTIMPLGHDADNIAIMP